MVTYAIRTIFIWALSRQNLSLGFLTKRDSNQPAQLQSLAGKMKFRLWQDILLSKKRKTKALISLHGCAGWSGPLLFAKTEDRFSRIEAHIIKPAHVPII